MLIAINSGMEKEEALKRMTTESPVYVLSVIPSSTKGLKCLRSKGWNFGKRPTEEQLPCYLNGVIYIPEFVNMSIDSIDTLSIQVEELG